MVGLAALVGFAFGLWVGNMSWQVKVLQKSRDGHRLEIDGRLFNVTEDQ